MATATHAIRVRTKTAVKFRTFGKSRRLKLVEVADVAINALNSLSHDQQERLIQGKPVGTNRASVSLTKPPAPTVPAVA
jgi:hypothetical protein